MKVIVGTRQKDAANTFSKDDAVLYATKMAESTGLNHYIPQIVASARIYYPVVSSNLWSRTEKATYKNGDILVLKITPKGEKDYQWYAGAKTTIEF